MKEPNMKAGDYIVGALLTVQKDLKIPCSQKTWERYLERISHFDMPKGTSTKTLLHIADYFNSILNIGLQDKQHGNKLN